MNDVITRLILHGTLRRSLDEEGDDYMTLSVPQRQGIIVYFRHMRQVRQLRRFGTVHYVSSRMHYAVLYVNRDRVDQTVNRLKKQRFVRRIQLSVQRELRAALVDGEEDPLAPVTFWPPKQQGRD